MARRNNEKVQERVTMKAIAVYPGKPHSMHLEEVPMPKITNIPNGQGVLVKVLRVGVDGTDKEREHE
jgi:threonine dehydrogenase-like Zn-dependent dehydrogenase